MKYLKTFEEEFFPKGKRLDDLLKLLKHLKYIFQDIGYGSESQYNTIHELYFENKKGRVFDIIGDYSTTLIFISVIMRIESIDDILANFIPEFFKTIDGLKLYKEDKNWYTTTFEIVGDVDDIISQITKDDIELKLKTKSYNL